MKSYALVVFPAAFVLQGCNKKDDGNPEKGGQTGHPGGDHPPPPTPPPAGACSGQFCIDGRDYSNNAYFKCLPECVNGDIQRNTEGCPGYVEACFAEHCQEGKSIAYLTCQMDDTCNQAAEKFWETLVDGYCTTPPKKDCTSYWNQLEACVHTADCPMCMGGVSDPLFCGNDDMKRYESISSKCTWSNANSTAF